MACKLYILVEFFIFFHILVKTCVQNGFLEHNFHQISLFFFKCESACHYDVDMEAKHWDGYRFTWCQCLGKPPRYKRAYYNGFKFRNIVENIHSSLQISIMDYCSRTSAMRGYWAIVYRVVQAKYATERTHDACVFTAHQ